MEKYSFEQAQNEALETKEKAALLKSYRSDEENPDSADYEKADKIIDRENEFIKKISPLPKAGENRFVSIREEVIGKKIADGSHAAVHDTHIEGAEDYVVKIGKTDEYEPPFFHAFKVRFPRERLSKVLEKVLGPQFKIFPDEEFIQNGLKEQLLMKEYFGYEDENAHLRSRQELLDEFSQQKGEVYEKLAQFVPQIDLDIILETLEKHMEDVFLPHEVAVMGHPLGFSLEKAQELIAQKKELPMTYYIFQKKITGNAKPLYKIKDEELGHNKELLERMLVFALLTKKMYEDTGKLIDTRSEEVGKHPFEWFQKTANIIVDMDQGQPYFIDTRWLWDKESIIGDRGLDLIDTFGIASVDETIEKYAGMLRNMKKKS